MKLYSRPISVGYHSGIVSCASLWAILYLAAIIILPYVTCYSLGGMWTKEVIFREQPSTRFRYEALVQAYGTSNGQIAAWSWSTSPELNDQLGLQLRPMKLASWEEDDDRDGIVERQRFALTIPLDTEQNEQLLSVTVVLGVQVVFSAEIELSMNSSLVMEANSPVTGRTWHQTSDLTLRSNRPLRSKELGSRPACPMPIWTLEHPVMPNGNAATAASVLAGEQLQARAQAIKRIPQALVP